ncbi:hypothetical protein TI39_contig4129g00005 [Zymoseptoria brevis]|uniref:Uncharacterized protein n=1 Tax=Zymoseptoria brevis TaxID=1047168 RepID=A0A0F4GG55_9PEZI|nr:hypothetical protein TI39_contig4129g00005 [Zymoseptoria brevis]
MATNALFSCGICTFTAPSKEAINDHRTESNTLRQLWRCPGCKDDFCFEGDLQAHFISCAKFNTWRKKMKWGKGTSAQRVRNICDLSAERREREDEAAREADSAEGVATVDDAELGEQRAAFDEEDENAPMYVTTPDKQSLAVNTRHHGLKRKAEQTRAHHHTSSPPPSWLASPEQQNTIDPAWLSNPKYGSSPLPTAAKTPKGEQPTPFNHTNASTTQLLPQYPQDPAGWLHFDDGEEIAVGMDATTVNPTAGPMKIPQQKNILEEEMERAVWKRTFTEARPWRQGAEHVSSDEGKAGDDDAEKGEGQED